MLSWYTWRSDFRTVLMCSAEDSCAGLALNALSWEGHSQELQIFIQSPGLGKLISGQDPFHVCTEWNYLEARSAERERDAPRCQLALAASHWVSLQKTVTDKTLELEENGSGRDSRGLLFLGHTQTWVWDPSFDRPSVTASAVLPLFSNSKSLP